MKRTGLWMICFCAFFSNTVFGQGLAPILTLTLSPRPSPYLSDWQSRREMATILIINNNTKTPPLSVKIDAELRLNGTLVASTKFESMPLLSIPSGPNSFYGGDIFSQQGIAFFGDVKQNISRSGMLPEGNYELCVRLLDAKTRNVLTSDCKNFTLTTISMPILLAPSDGAEIVAGLEPTILFSWTPLVSSSTPTTNFRLRFVELLPSQEPKNAIMNNRPLFERIAPSVAQLLWPSDIHLPAEGGTFVWSIQPEDQSGNPLITNERFARPFKVIVLPSQDQCLKLLTQLNERKDTLVSIEETYWHSYELFLRLNKLLEDAQLRADAYEIKKLQVELNDSEGRVLTFKQQHESARAIFDAAVERYKQCLGK